MFHQDRLGTNIEKTHCNRTPFTRRSIDTKQLEQIVREPESRTMLRLLGFQQQSAIELADGGGQAVVGTPGLPVGGFYGGSLRDDDGIVRLPPRAGQPRL